MMNTRKQQTGLLAQLRDFGAGPLIGMLISMLTVPVTTRLIIPEEFGKASLFTLFQTLFALISTLGLDQAYVRFYNQKDINHGKLLFHASIPSLMFSLFFSALGLIFQRPLSEFLFAQYEPLLVVTISIFLPTLLFNRFSLLTLRMELRGKLYSFINVFAQAINFAILLTLLLLYEKSFKSIVYSTIISSLLTTALAMVLTRRSWQIFIRAWDTRLALDLIRFGLPLVPATLLSWVLNSFDKVGLRAWGTFKELGLYSAAFKIVSILAVAQSIFTTAWIPIAYKWHEEGARTKKFDQVSTIVLAAMSLGYTTIICLRNVILLILGPEYRNTEKIFIFLLMAPVLYTVSETTTLGIPFSRKTVYNLYISLAAAILNLLGNYFLIPVLGASGAALTTAFSYLVFFWGRTLFSRKLWYPFKRSKYIYSISLLFFLAGIVMFDLPRILELVLLIGIVYTNIHFLKKDGITVSFIKRHLNAA